jgi:hypothetical protein
MKLVDHGWILLTAAVGGPGAKWKDKALSKSIIACQRRQIIGYKPNYSHAELLTNDKGQTFAARWRTRHRDNGLADYIGSNILIGQPTSGMSKTEFLKRWFMADMNRFDGRIYPVPRILLSGLTAYVLPSFLRKISLFDKWGMCSEVVACLYTANPCYPFCQTGYKGIFPGNLEYVVKYGDAFEVVFEGLLTEDVLTKADLPTYRS